NSQPWRASSQQRSWRPSASAEPSVIKLPPTTHRRGAAARWGRVCRVSRLRGLAQPTTAELRQRLGDLHDLGAALLTDLVNDRYHAGIDQASTAGAQASLADGLRDGGAAVDRINDRPVHPVDLLAILLNLLIGERIIGTGGHAHLEVLSRNLRLIPDAGVHRCAIFASHSFDCTSRSRVWGIY